MSRMTLGLEQLTVESFDVGPYVRVFARAGGREDTGEDQPAFDSRSATCPARPSCAVSCAGHECDTEQTCPETCVDTCFETCRPGCTRPHVCDEG